MPALLLASPNQLSATAGRTPRLALADSLRELAPLAVQNREFALRRRAQENAEAAQAAQQEQQTTGNLISGVGTVGQGALVAKQLGLLGGGTAAASTVAAGAPLASAATPVLAGTEVGATLAAPPLAAAATPAVAGLATGGSAAAAGGAGATAGGSAGLTSAGVGSTLTAAAPLALAAGGGLAFGALAGPQIREAAGGGTKGRVASGLSSAAVGAGVGLLVAGPVGALVGGVVGGLSGGLCVIHEASYGKASREVAIARAFRDTRLTRGQLRAYYYHFASVAARMHQDARYRRQVRTELVDRLVRYGAADLGMNYSAPSPKDIVVATTFLARLTTLGAGMPPVVRPDGSVI